MRGGGFGAGGTGEEPIAVARTMSRAGVYTPLIKARVVPLAKGRGMVRKVLNSFGLSLWS